MNFLIAVQLPVEFVKKCRRIKKRLSYQPKHDDGFSLLLDQNLGVICTHADLRGLI